MPHNIFHRFITIQMFWRNLTSNHSSETFRTSFSGVFPLLLSWKENCLFHIWRFSWVKRIYQFSDDPKLFLSLLSLVLHIGPLVSKDISILNTGLLARFILGSLWKPVFSFICILLIEMDASQRFFYFYILHVT